MKLPDFEQIGRSLKSAQPLEMYILPFRAYVLVGQLQLALRHPQNTGPGSNIAREIAHNLQERLSEINPAIAQSLEHGWNPQLDFTDAEFEEVQRTGQVTPRVEVHNTYALYELNQDGTRSNSPLLMFSRPQDWGDRFRWHYHRCKIELEMGGTRYINHCHVWQEVERNSTQAFAACGESLFWAIQPGTPEELCSNQYLAEEDFWDESWGAMPPMWRAPDENDDYYDPVVFYDPIDGPITDSQLTAIVNEVPQEFGEEDGSIPVGGKLYMWRVWHPDQERAFQEAQEQPFDEPPFTPSQFLYELTEEGERFTMRSEEDEPFCGMMIGTHLEGTPTLAQSWAERGWQLESQGTMVKLANC